MTSLALDLSILPGCFTSQDDRTSIPGEKLFSLADGYKAGNGCYEKDGSIFASLAGFVFVFAENSKNGTINVVEVRKKTEEKNHVLPDQGNIVTARIEAITLKYAKCSILCVEDALLVHEFNSTLRKEDIREKEKDKVELYKCVQPGDIILARVLGYGDSSTAYLLSTAEDELGVVSARGENGERLVPDTSDSYMLNYSTSNPYSMHQNLSSNADYSFYLPPPPVPPNLLISPPPVPPSLSTFVSKPPVKSSSVEVLATTSKVSNAKATTTQCRKRFANSSLRIVNGKRIYTGSKECYQYAEKNNCMSGAFCAFEHNGLTEHQTKRMCHKLLSGTCLEPHRCLIGEHNLLPHQYPVCQQYLNCLCINDNCPYLHVKHTDGLEPCADFNNGNCRLGIMCKLPHRYYYSNIKNRSSTQELSPKLNNNIMDSIEEEVQETEDETSLGLEPDADLEKPLKWFL